MKYWQLQCKDHVDGHVKGYFPYDYKYYSSEVENFFNRDFNLGNLPDFEVRLDGIILDKNVRVTDFIGIGALLKGVCISDRVKKILEEYNLPNHRFYPVTFHQPSKIEKKIEVIEGYWLLHFELEFGKNVDFEKSEFVNDILLLGKSDPSLIIRVNSLEEYKAVRLSTKKGLVATKLVLKSSFDTSLDVWATRFLTVGGSYFSSRLIKRLKKEKITGFEALEPLSELVFE
ncbi:hypothetical protein QM480_13220 [Flectobacillus sp. DC10W]|uniref:Immunity protein 43 n=1 Tax=Flectobacillus longus TaxID=2984207 RepID=A0ABT6YNW9_9BACT|nr:hypothetical protein [Flectobacillus longus]MDI9865294.1 hypothetical protein [Flectobacillus longus]